mmetsp:Transcript_13205/g.26936  ORF Transcript_13205/g.26936 Transcript_13205/m.26936 type:complete len:241 (-) Transcript_13205:841-1563(-)
MRRAKGRSVNIESAPLSSPSSTTTVPDPLERLLKVSSSASVCALHQEPCFSGLPPLLLLLPPLLSSPPPPPRSQYLWSWSRSTALTKHSRASLRWKSSRCRAHKGTPTSLAPALLLLLLPSLLLLSLLLLEEGNKGSFHASIVSQRASAWCADRPSHGWAKKDGGSCRADPTRMKGGGERGKCWSCSGAAAVCSLPASPRTPPPDTPCPCGLPDAALARAARAHAECALPPPPSWKSYSA